MVGSHETLSDPVFGLAAQRVRQARQRDVGARIEQLELQVRQIQTHLISQHQHIQGIRVIGDGTQVPAQVARLSPDGYFTFWSEGGSINIDNEQAENASWVNWTIGGLG